MDSSLFTPKCTLVPSRCFDESESRELLGRVWQLSDDDQVKWVSVPSQDAVLVYAYSGREDNSCLPEMFYVLDSLQHCPDFNKIVASICGGYLYLAVGQGERLLIANAFKSVDFTTAEYYIFYVLKSLQINPEQSVISFRTPLSQEEERSLYRYFKDVTRL